MTHFPIPVLVETTSTQADGYVPFSWGRLFVRIFPLKARQILRAAPGHELLNLLRLFGAIQQRDKRSIEKYFDRVVPQELEQQKQFEAFLQSIGSKSVPPDPWKRIVKRMQNPLSEIGGQLNRRTDGTRIVLWKPNREPGLVPGLYCVDETTALAVAVLVSLNSPTGPGVCWWCGKVFRRKKAIRNNPYCSSKCGSNARQARHRAKHRRKEK